MPTTIYETVEVTLSNGETLKVKPLTITYLKKFMEQVNKLQSDDVKTENDVLEVLIDAGMVCMQAFGSTLANDRDALQANIEVPTLMKILEIAGGLKLSGDDPNAPKASLLGNN